MCATFAAFCFDRYSLAAVMLKQLTFKQAVQHKTAVLKVACMASTEKNRTPALGVFFDEVVRLDLLQVACGAQRGRLIVRSCRRGWEDKSGKLHSFNPGAEAGELKDAWLTSAKTAYDLAFPAARAF